MFCTNPSAGRCVVPDIGACGAKQSSDMPASDTDSAASAALPVKAMNAKRVDENPYMAKSDANIHHDGYNTDSTDEVLPLGIYPEINVSYEENQRERFACHFTLTATATQSFRCSAASPSAI